MNNDKCTFTTAGVSLTPLLSRQRYIIFNLLYYRINKAHYSALWGTDVRDDFGTIIDGLINDQFMKDIGSQIILTELGKIWLQNIMLEFFDNSMWNNSIALKQQQSSWAMNNHMIDIGASDKTFWLEGA